MIFWGLGRSPGIFLKVLDSSLIFKYKVAEKFGRQAPVIFHHFLSQMDKGVVIFFVTDRLSHFRLPITVELASSLVQHVLYPGPGVHQKQHLLAPD